MNVTKKIADYVSGVNRKGSMSSNFRAKRSEPLLQMIRSVYEAKGRVKIIDVGGTELYWKIIPESYFDDYEVEITLVNLPSDRLPENHGPFVFVNGDGCDLSGFQDDSFHIAHSNSVLEHVGDWDRMVKFSNEIKRVANQFFVQTPNYWFPLEPHCMTPCFQWFPKPFRVWLVLHFQLGYWAKAQSVSDAVSIVESARLLNYKMFQALFVDSTIYVERFLLLPKSFVAIKK